MPVDTRPIPAPLPDYPSTSSRDTAPVVPTGVLRETLQPQYWMRPIGLLTDGEIVRAGRAPRTGLPRARRILGVPVILHGWSFLPPWTHRVMEESEADVAPLIDMLRKRPELGAIYRSDPRFGLWFAATQSTAYTLAEAVETYDRLDVRPLVRKVYLLRALLAELDGTSTLSLADELCSIARYVLGAEATIPIRRYGLDGRMPRSLPEVATRRRGQAWVERILKRFDAAVEGVRVWLPALDRALVEGAPSHWHPEALASAALRFGRSPPALERAPDVAADTATIARVLRQGARAPGVYSVPFALRCLARAGVNATPEDVLATVSELPQVEWLYGGPPDGWFWYPGQASRSGIVTVIRKILAIGPADLTAFSEGLLRHSRRHEPLWVPPEVIAAVAERLEGVRVEGDTVFTELPLDRSVLTVPERTAVEFFEREGPDQRFIRIQQAVVATGVHRGAMALFALYSPILRPTARGRYALVSRTERARGSETAPATSGWMSAVQLPGDLVEVAKLALRVAPEDRTVLVRFRRHRQRVEWEMYPINSDLDTFDQARAMGAANGTVALALVNGAQTFGSGSQPGTIAVEGYGHMVEGWFVPGEGMKFGEVDPCPEGVWLPPHVPSELGSEEEEEEEEEEE